MNDFLPQYRQLLGDKHQLAQLRGASSMADFFARLKQLWSCPALADAELIQVLHGCNQQVHDIAAEQLAGNWFAASYRPQSPYLPASIGWCSPCGAATEGFQDQYISRCQQQLLNQFVRPRTSLQSLLAARFTGPSPVPAGFVFHLSRCGSTLISGCLSECAQANVLSEPPAITELLLDKNLGCAVQLQALSKLLHMQQLAMPEHRQLIIKWNAWDLLRWQAIRAAYPQVPVVLLVRDPLEILASHAREAGRHMSGDPGLQHLHPAFGFAAGASEPMGLLGQRVQVLQALLMQMHKIAGEAGVILVDYRALDRAKMLELARFFNLPIDAGVAERLGTRMQFHSKTAAQVTDHGETFIADSARKRDLFSAEHQAYIAGELDGLYQQLFRRPLSSISEK